MKKIATHTLGCKLNFAETSNLVGKFIKAGYTSVDFKEWADVYVVNTCTVTAVAEKKCRTVIRQAHKTNPDAIIAVIGCFAQNEAQAVSQIEGVDIILGNDQKHNLLDYVERWNHQTIICDDQPKSFELAYSRSDRTRTFFKVQDGCDYFCTYCAIPFARGRSRSATIAETLKVAEEIALSGSKEIVLTGVNTGTFGIHNHETFLDLLKGLDKIQGIERYRISSIEPNLITDEILEFVAHSRAFAPHFHIPIQAASDVVLKNMHRHYDTAFYREKILRIKDLMPDACIAADLMVGFNGETDTEFENGIRFIEDIPISYLHVFTYSNRPNTMALKMPGAIPMHIRRERSEVMHQLSDRKRHLFIEQQTGKSRPVLWESTNHNGMIQGWTDNYIRLQAPVGDHIPNTITTTEINNLTLVDNFSFDN